MIFLKSLQKRKCNSGGYTDEKMPEQLKTLTDFYKNYYSLTIANNEIIYYDKLPYVLPYEAIDMLNIVNSVLNTGKRPDIFCREVNS